MGELKGIKNKRILVAGDIMLDIYYYGTVERISPEAPVPVFLSGDTVHRPGGAANVAVNLASNGQSVSVLSVLGKDGNGEILKSLFEASGIHTGYLLETARPTTAKCRLLAGNSQQVLRIDSEDSREIDKGLQEALLQRFRRHVGEFDMIVLSDYMKGFFPFDFTRELIDAANKAGVRVLVDAKDGRAKKYSGAYMVKPNRKELRILTGMPIDTEGEVRSASEILCKTCNCDYVLTTCGANGMLLVSRDGIQRKLTAAAREVFDVTGAGDTVIAYIAICLANGMDVERAVIVANYAAGLQVSKIGASVVHIDEVEKVFRGASNWSGVVHKSLGIGELEKFRKRNKDKKIIFTNGCFDILHIGHIRYLREAARLGDLLVVGLNSDGSVRRLKGARRPVNCQENRLEVLAALEFVDYVVIFEEDTPLRAIKACQPDILVKGGDYRVEDVVGREIVEKQGGMVKILPFVEGKSTTGLIQRIAEKI